MFHIHFFWLFTILGLTVPYRIRFGKHCDELRVAVIKEVSSKAKVEKESFATIANPSWFASPRSWLWGPATAQDLIKQKREKFRLKMREMSLYNPQKDILAAEETICDDSSQNATKVENQENDDDDEEEEEVLAPPVSCENTSFT
jgi:hypothetical protein